MTHLELIKKLREMTGVGMVDVQEALKEAHNDEKKAIELLRMKGEDSEQARRAGDA